jgi:uncharacterized protein (DUF885 family)
MLYREMEDTSLDQIYGISEREVRETRARMEDIAARLEPARSTISLLKDLAREHPAPSELIPTVKAILENVIEFVASRELLSSAPNAQLEIVETPFLLRVLGPMVLVTPGALDMYSSPSYLMLTMPRVDWSLQRAEAHLTNFNARALQLGVIREAYPGYYLHYSFQKSSSSRIRRLLTSRASRDGWGAYAEQMLLDEGFEWDDPVLRLRQLHQALIMQCGLLAAVGLHSEKLSLSQVVQLFIEQAYLDPEQAAREARSVAIDWTHASAALGKLQILKLRRDFVVDGDLSRTLRAFHDGVLTAAGLPHKLVRLRLLPEDRRPTLE